MLELQLNSIGKDATGRLEGWKAYQDARSKYTPSHMIFPHHITTAYYLPAAYPSMYDTHI